MGIQHQNWGKRLEIALHVLIWPFFLVAMIMTFYQFIGFKGSLLRGVANVASLAILCYLHIWFVNRYWERQLYWQFGLFSFLSLLFFTLLRSEVNGSFDYSDLTEKRINWFLSSLFTNLSLMVVCVLYQLLYNRYRSEKHNLAIINEQQEAQLQALRAQINPHFLFNTLNNIYSLTMVDPKRTAEMVLKLSHLLRYVIYDGQEKQVNLKKEVGQIEEFIGLFQMRMEEPANIQFTHSGLTGTELIEPMILIPFLENGFKHGDFDTNPKAFLTAELSVQNNLLEFQVVNSKNDQNRQKDPYGGVGLENIQKRLALKYQGQHQLDIQDQEHLFSVQLQLQLNNDPNENLAGR